MVMVEIGYLADHVELVPTLADWFYQEWGHGVTTLTFKDFEEQFHSRLNRDKLPLSVVALSDGIPVATASLKLREMDGYPHYLHWLGGVYTLPEYRRRGIGSQVIEFAVGEAKRLGVRKLYLYTRGSESLYARLGWKIIEKPMVQGRLVSIMRRVLKNPDPKGLRDL